MEEMADRRVFNPYHGLRLSTRARVWPSPPHFAYIDTSRGRPGIGHRVVYASRLGPVDMTRATARGSAKGAMGIQVGHKIRHASWKFTFFLKERSKKNRIQYQGRIQKGEGGNFGLEGFHFVKVIAGGVAMGALRG